MSHDRDEQISLMEPLLIAEDSSDRRALTDLSVELAQAATRLTSSLPSGVMKALTDLVRAMNCYYSNLIEGHDTHPVDIERALKSEFSSDPQNRDLQFEAKAHIEVQRWMDEGGLQKNIYGVEAMCEIHRRFCELLPDELLWVKDPHSGEKVKVIPGELRDRDVKVGRLFTVSPGAVPRFLKRYEEVYSGLSKSEAIISAAAAHHRLLWIHPFLDGNGRVARLVSNAALSDLLDSGNVWSVARGFARSVEDYKAHLMKCDQERQGSLDGRGNLSTKALSEFTYYFLNICLDQVKFMETLITPDVLQRRIDSWSKEAIIAGRLQPKSDLVLRALLFRDEIPRGEIPEFIGKSERSARRVIADLLQCEVVKSDSHRGALRLAFPAKLAQDWMPNLFPS